MDLDELIGEIRREAARRRAAPDFPVDQEAAVAADLDGLGPVGVGPSGADLPRILGRLRELAANGSELPALVASSVNALAARLDHIARRRAPSVSDPGTSSWSGVRSAAVEPLLGSTGPVVVLGPGAGEWVAALVSAGVDASGVDPDRPVYSDDGTVRAGSVLEFLASVGDGALAGALVVGGVVEVDALCAELARVTSLVVVCAEAPWSWRLRVGDVAADLAAARPLSPETWLAGLSAVGRAATGSYGPDGREYVILARTLV